MTRKYNKDNPLPPVELARLRRNTNRRISRRKKAQIAQKTIDQFQRILFEAITAKGKELNDADSMALKTVIEELVKEYVFSEKDAATLAARKMKRFFTEYELTEQNYHAVVKSTDWARLDREILELEIKKGMDEINAGYYTTIATKEDVETLLANIKRRGLRRLKAKQKRKNHSVV